MNIQSQHNYNPNFQALHIANCGDLKLYKITTQKDLNFLKELPQKIKMEKLMPDLEKSKSDRWNEMLEYAVDNAQYPINTTYIETKNNKICGIITFEEGKTTILDCICTFPVEIGKKVKFAGKTLFYQMFKDFLAFSGKKIKLEAIVNGPYDTISKYETLGFKTTSNVYPTKTEMETHTPKVKETLENLSKLLKYQKCREEKVNLNQIIDFD